MEALETQTVYSKLDWAWAWRGIRVTTPLLGAAPGLMLFPVAAFSGMLLLATLLMLAGAVFFSVLQYRRSENLLASLLRAWRLPRHLVPEIPCNEPPPFPLTRQALQ